MSKQYLICTTAYVGIIIAALGYAQLLCTAGPSSHPPLRRTFISYIRITATSLFFLCLLLCLPQIDPILVGIVFLGTVWIRLLHLTTQEYSDDN